LLPKTPKPQTILLEIILDKLILNAYNETVKPFDRKVPK